MKTTRRDLLMLAGGTAVGALLTPAPWRLVKDTSLWSESWPGVPRPKPGAVSARFSNCPLCPAGCAVRARCTGKQPVSLAGVSGHPLSHGALCVYGIAAHHLPYHPARLKCGAADEATAAVSEAIAKCGTEQQIAVLDLRPGRTHSWTYRRALAAIRNGLYLAPQRLPMAVDLGAAKTVLSFGTPVLDSWGTPGNVFAARDGFRLIQAEAVESRTASLADLWLPVRAGAESTLALRIARILVEDGASTKGLPGGFRERMQQAEAVDTGIAEGQLRTVAHLLLEDGPAVVLGTPETADLAALNLLLGAPGRTLVSRRETPVPAEWKNAAPETELASVADGTLRVLLIDESAPGEYVPWHAIERKLTADAVVVAFSWSREGYGRHAKYVLPTAVYPESLDDIPAAIDSPVAAFRLSTPLVEAPAGMVDPARFVGKLGGVDADAALRQRADAIAGSGRGRVFTYAGAQSIPLPQLKPDEFWKALNEGACWLDERDAKAPPPTLQFRETAASPVAIAEERGAAALVSPLLSKVHQESGLRLARHEVALHPSSGFAEGAHALLETGCGRLEVQVTIDSSVPPGVVQAAAGAELLDVCGAGSRARVVRL